MERDVIAIHNGKYYLNTCHGFEGTPFVPMYCDISIEMKSADFSSKTFWNDSSFPTFNEKSSGGVWSPRLGQIMFSSDASSELLSRDFFRVSPTTLFYPSVNGIVEMTSAGKDEIEICEYELNETCNTADKKTYLIGPEINFTINGDGNIYHHFAFTNLEDNSLQSRDIGFRKAFMFAKNRDIALKINPTNGSIIDSVTDCNGTLKGGEYKISGLTEDCKITVNFAN